MQYWAFRRAHDAGDDNDGLDERFELTMGTDRRINYFPGILQITDLGQGQGDGGVLTSRCTRRRYSPTPIR